MGVQDLKDIPQLSYIYIAVLQSAVQMPHRGDDICLPQGARHRPSAGEQAANALFCRKATAVCPGFPGPQEVVGTAAMEKTHRGGARV